MHPTETHHSEPNWASLELGMGRQTAAEIVAESAGRKSQGDSFTKLYPLAHTSDFGFRDKKPLEWEETKPDPWWKFTQPPKPMTLAQRLSQETHLYPIASAADRHAFGKYLFRIPHPEDADFANQIPDYHQAICQLQKGATIEDLHEARMPEEVFFSNGYLKRNIVASGSILLELAATPQAEYDQFFQVLKDVVRSGYSVEMKGDNILMYSMIPPEEGAQLRVIDPGALWSPGQPKPHYLSTVTPEKIKEHIFMRMILPDEEERGELRRSRKHAALLTKTDKAYAEICKKIDHAVRETRYPETEAELLELHGSDAHKNYHPSTLAEANRAEYPLVPLHQTGSGLFLLKELDRRIARDAQTRGGP